jgi:hypothetical protein
MSGLRENVAKAIWDKQGYLEDIESDVDPFKRLTWERLKEIEADYAPTVQHTLDLAHAAILALRQWMDAEGLKIVPDDVSNWHIRFTQFASGEVQTALDSAPDVLGKP